MDSFKNECPNCGHAMVVNDLACPDCGVHVTGTVALPRLAHLAPEDREFIELFVLASGSLKEVGQVLGISYPSVRQRLDRVIARLSALRGAKEQERLAVLERLERNEITAQEAVQLLKEPADLPTSSQKEDIP